MRFYASAIIITLCLPLLSGCLTNDESINPIDEEVAPEIYGELNIQGRGSIIGEISNQNLTIQQIEKFNSLIKQHREVDFDLNDIPTVGGNWTHYFVCSNGEKIEYIYPMQTTFSCDGTDEVLSGEQYETSWIAHRHKEVIREYAVDSAISYYLTNNSSDAESAREVLFHYAEIYGDLPVQDKYGNEGRSGGKLTRQSLDEAVLLIDLAWIHYLLQPVLTPEENTNVTLGLILPMVETLQAAANQGKDALSNWFSYHNAAIGMAAVSTNNHSLMQESLNQWNGLYHQLQNGFDEDGLWHEASIAYHNYTLTAMAINIEAARYFGIMLDQHSWTSSNNLSMAIYDPFVAHLAFVKPDGTFPRLNDDIRGTNLASIVDLLEFTNRYWSAEVPSSILLQAREMSDSPSLRSSLWMSPINHSSTQLTSFNYESFGVSILRHNEMYILVDYGPHGGWHGHFDKLSVEVASGDSNFISDPGTVVYSLPSSRDWYRTSFAHSLPLIGFENQPEVSGHLLNHNFSNHSSFVMAQYLDENQGMNVTRLLLVLSTVEYGDIIIDLSHWSGGVSQIATQTYHFPNTSHAPSTVEFSNASLPFDLEPYANLRLLEEHQTLNFSSGDGWHTVLYVSEGNDLYGGTSLNGGAFFLQSNQKPSTNSTMLTMHTYGVQGETIVFNYTSTMSSSVISLADQTVVVDWANYHVGIVESDTGT